MKNVLAEQKNYAIGLAFTGDLHWFSGRFSFAFQLEFSISHVVAVIDYIQIGEFE